MTATTEKPNVHEMVVVHRTFRQELGMLPALVGGTAEGDRRRARVLGRHYRFVTTVLHHHHEYEDEHFWPKLLERCPMDAELITRMERQHERVAELLDSLPATWREWEARADADSRARLATQLAALSAALEEHLHDEETFLLPIMENHLSVAEWKAFGTHATKKMDKTKGMLWLGLAFETCTPEEKAHTLAKIPGWARVLWHLVGEAQYRRGVARIRGNRP
jgi:hemerythrin-like domain-containing protein